MRGPVLIVAVLAMGLLSSAAALAAVPADMPLSSLGYPGAPKPVYDDPKPPYAMNYADEAAQKLGVENGHLNLFSTHPADNPLVPVVSGGVGGDGAMLKLQWHPSF